MPEFKDPKAPIIPENLDQLTEEGITRKVGGNIGIIIFIIGVLWAFFHLYTAGAGQLTASLQRSAHLSVALALCFLYFPINKKNEESFKQIPIYDILLALISFASVFYVFIYYEDLAHRVGRPETMDLLFGGIAVLAILEASRRAFGWVLPIVTIVFLFYSYAGPYMPDVIAHRGYGLRRVIDHLYLTGEGIFGIPVGVAASFVFVFVIFGSFFQASGAGLYMVQLAYAMLGKTKGGPAKAAVAGSGFMGSIVGSSVANTVVTGSITIPMMKKAGYKPEVAGGIETAASTDGQFLPPIMGAAAFIMAEFTGIPYHQIIIHAALPAIVSYIALLLMVHLEADKTGIKPLPPEEIPKFIPTFLSGIYFWFPVIVLIYYLLILRYTPLTAGFYGIVAMLLISLILKLVQAYKGIRAGSDNPLMAYFKQLVAMGKEFINGLDSAAKAMAGIGVACACAGIIVGVISLTGLGLRMTILFAVFAGDNLLLLLFLAAGMSLILGMGLPTTAKYVIMAALVAPAVLFVEPTLPVVAVHLFILYYAILADDTPPVGVAAFSAAAIARSDPIRTGIQGFKLDMGAFLLPFMFVYNTQFLLIDTTWYKAALVVGTSIFGIYCFSTVIQRWFFTKLKLWEMAVMLAISISMIWPTILSDIIGVSVFVLIYIGQRRRKARELASGDFHEIVDSHK
ncbi:MAG: TRAP transporter permease [Bacillota bacterium]